MKLLFKVTGQNVRNYNSKTKGWELIEVREDYEVLKNIVSVYENSDWFEQEDGSVNDQNGEEVFNPKYPNEFEFGDYKYIIEDLEEVWSDNEILAIQQSVFADQFPQFADEEE